VTIDGSHQFRRPSGRLKNLARPDDHQISVFQQHKDHLHAELMA
jgi:hypothetical protein